MRYQEGMTWKPKRAVSRSRWREFLTDEERETIKAIDAAKQRWKKLNLERSTIVNRAIKRAINAGNSE